LFVDPPRAVVKPLAPDFHPRGAQNNTPPNLLVKPSDSASVRQIKSVGATSERSVHKLCTGFSLAAIIFGDFAID
jgi:hypothetical protein